jgi:predicted flap endonuclease-1-like 5' DNA nuclease
MAIGHVNQQEAFKDWELDRLQKRDNFERYLELLDDNILPRTPLEVRMRHLRLPLGEADTDLFSRVMLEGGCLLVEPEAFGRLPRLFLSVFVPTTPLIIIPIKPGGRVIGLLVVDNKFTEAPITETEIKILNTYVATELVAISEGTLHHYVRTADVAALSQEKVLLVDSDEGPKQIRHSDLIRIVGIGEEYERRLFAAGIFSQAELLEAAATRRDRQDTAEKAGISHSLILTWSNHIDLCRIPGIDEEMAYLLELVGVDTVPELAQRNANNLHQSLTEVILSQAKKRKLNVEEVARWIELAGGLTRVLQY